MLPFIQPTVLVFSHYRSWFKEYELKWGSFKSRGETQVTLKSFERDKKKGKHFWSVMTSPQLARQSLHPNHLSCLTWQNIHTSRLLFCYNHSFPFYFYFPQILHQRQCCGGKGYRNEPFVYSCYVFYRGLRGICGRAFSLETWGC